MKHLNEKHTWFNIDAINDYVICYTTKNHTKLPQRCIKILNEFSEVAEHHYGFILFKKPLQWIPNEAFQDCRNLTSMIIPNSVTRIGDNAFSLCSNLSTVNIPKGVEDIRTMAFCGCKINSINIPNSVIRIESAVFDTCKNLKEIFIPNSVQVISFALFYGCDSLCSVTVASDNAYYDSRDDCNAIIETATNKLISGCYKSHIPDTVTCIHPYAFFGCRGLKTMTIPVSVQWIGGKSFKECPNLSDIFYKGTVEQFKKMYICDEAISDDVKIHCTDGDVTI